MGVMVRYVGEQLGREDGADSEVSIAVQAEKLCCKLRRDGHLSEGGFVIFKIVVAPD